jgi:hypothetical protein
MVYTACAEWFQDWVDAEPPTLVDEYDLSQWMEHEMRGAIEMFLQNAFHSAHARNDAIMILRALAYEYYLLRSEAAKAAVETDLESVRRVPALPQTPQKTAAWHLESREILSGHEFGGIVAGGKAEYNAIVAKKCAPPPEQAPRDQTIVFLTPPEGLSPFKWGWRFEPVARDLYEMHFAQGVVFEDLGRVRHGWLPRLGASPDGLITTGPRAGRLVELKCPISRQITGSIPVQYWIQMQLQAEVCDVAAVEYFEVQLGSILQRADKAHMLAYAEAVGKSKLPWIGKICVCAPPPHEGEEATPDTYNYVYSPLFTANTDGIDECEGWGPPVEEGVVLESALWWVKDYYTTTVLRNPRWWEDVGMPAYQTFWKEVMTARREDRYRYIPQPMFVNDSESDSETEETEEIGRETPARDAAAEVDETANDGAASTSSSAVEGWLGEESDHDLEKDTSAQSDTDVDQGH